MAGVRKDGILEVSDTATGPSVPVKITEPIGPSVKADSVSVTLATDEDAVDVVVNNFPANQPVTGPITNVELRAIPVPVSATDLDIRNLSVLQDTIAAFIVKLQITGNAPAAVSVGIASALAVAANAARAGLVLTNTSINNIFLGFGANAAVLGSGIAIPAGGQFKMDEYSFSTQAINAIAAGASSNLGIQEFQ